MIVSVPPSNGHLTALVCRRHNTVLLEGGGQHGCLIQDTKPRRLVECHSFSFGTREVVKNKVGHRKHITKVWSTSGMLGRSEVREDALLPRKFPTAGSTGSITVLNEPTELHSDESNYFISLQIGWVLVLIFSGSLRCEQSNKASLFPFLSQGNATGESHTFLFIRKYQSWKHSVKCKIQYLTSHTHTHTHTHTSSPRSKNILVIHQKLDFLLFEYTASQEGARGTRGKDTNIASPEQWEYCASVNMKNPFLSH